MSVKDYTRQEVQVAYIAALTIGVISINKSMLSRDYRFTSILVKVVFHSILTTSNTLRVLLIIYELIDYTIDYE